MEVRIIFYYLWKHILQLSNNTIYTVFTKKYSGTNAEFTKADTVIFRTDLYNMSTGRKEYNFKRTLKYDSKWLDSKYFVSLNGLNIPSRKFFALARLDSSSEKRKISLVKSKINEFKLLDGNEIVLENVFVFLPVGNLVILAPTSIPHSCIFFFSFFFLKQCLQYISGGENIAISKQIWDNGFCILTC